MPTRSKLAQMTPEQREAERASNRRYQQANKLEIGVRLKRNEQARRVGPNWENISEQRAGWQSAYWSNPQRRIGKLANAAVARAKESGLPYDEHLSEVVATDPPTNCPCCGKIINYSAGIHSGHRADSPSLDRVIPTLGYTIANTAVICQNCNRLKSNITRADLKMFGAYLDRFAPLIVSAAV